MGIEVKCGWCGGELGAAPLGGAEDPFCSGACAKSADLADRAGEERPKGAPRVEEAPQVELGVLGVGRVVGASPRSLEAGVVKDLTNGAEPVHGRCLERCAECLALPYDQEPSECICHWCLIRHSSRAYQLAREALFKINDMGGPAADIAAKTLEEALHLSVMPGLNDVPLRTETAVPSANSEMVTLRRIAKLADLMFEAWGVDTHSASQIALHQAVLAWRAVDVKSEAP